MTDAAVSQKRAAAEKRLKRRYREEARFRAYGIGAIGLALLALVVLLGSIVGESISAFTKHEIRVELTLDPTKVDPAGDRDPARISANVAAFSGLFRQELAERFPEGAEDRDIRRQLNRIVSTLAAEDLTHKVAGDPSLIGQTLMASAPVSDTADLYLKGMVTEESLQAGAAEARITRTGSGVAVEAPGGFADSYEIVVRAIRAEADASSAAAERSAVSIARSEQRLATLEGRRAASLAADPAATRAAANAEIEAAEAAHVELARAAGAQDAKRLRAALDSGFATARETLDKESRELARKAARYAEQSAEAMRKGEPSAETRRLQAEAAFLAADRKQVDARRLAEIQASLAGQDIRQLTATASLLAGRPLAPLAPLTLETGRTEAAMEVNRVEVEAAEAALADQVRRVALLQAAVAELKSVSAQRAQALEDVAGEAAQSRLARLERELESRREAGALLAAFASPAVAPSATPPVDGAALDSDPADAAPADAEAPAPVAAPTQADRDTEIAGQLGLDLGGTLGLAHATGAAEAGRPGADAALKALMSARVNLEIGTVSDDIERLKRKQARDAATAGDINARIATQGAPLDLGEFSPSVLVAVDGGVVKAVRLTPDRAEGSELIALKGGSSAGAGDWSVRTLETPEADRLVNDRQVAWLNALRDEGAIVRVANLDLLTKADSTYPELAGLAAAIAGSFWIMIVTLVLSLPIGVMAAIYLQEFAPKNRFTDFIEVNINNLAAVPSIVFGLLGAAVFINFFGLPRSAPLVGGLVLSLITLPTIIIATRAALAAVPPSIREGALAVGASLPQAIFHHVLPLAAPGIMTGAIIGLARALGETAPLLLIGMVAFVADPPSDMFESATALPVLVYKWSSSAERAWQPMTSAAIIVLLVFLFAMNALAVYLRRRLERRW